MEIEVLVRIVLVLLGLVFLILSAAGAILTLAKGAGRVKAFGEGGNPLAGVTKLIDALRKLVEAMTAAPLWLALGGLGVFLILLGALLPLSFK